MKEKIKELRKELINEISSSVIRGTIYCESVICSFTGIDVSEIGFDSSITQCNYVVKDCLGDTIIIEVYDGDELKDVEVNFKDCSIDFLEQCYELMEK